MLSDKELQELLEDLYSENLSMRVAVLKDLEQYPSGDTRVLSYLEALLDDKTPCVVSIPYLFGEIHWLAAHALAAERKVLGIKEPVSLKGIVRPLDTEEFDALRKVAGIEDRGGVEGVLESFSTLREMGRLPVYDLEL